MGWHIAKWREKILDPASPPVEILENLGTNLWESSDEWAIIIYTFWKIFCELIDNMNKNSEF